MTEDGFPAPDHDHRRCVRRTLAQAQDICREKGVRLTALRREVLREVASSHEAIGAYDILERLSENRRRLAPVSIYRVLQTFTEAGVLHRLESRNAYIICRSPHKTSGLAAFLICDKCQQVAEVPAKGLGRTISKMGEAFSFQPAGAVIEVGGLCAHCAGGPISSSEMEAGS